LKVAGADLFSALFSKGFLILPSQQKRFTISLTLGLWVRITDPKLRGADRKSAPAALKMIG